MASINKTKKLKTHEGGVASHISPLLQLRRSVMACLLWENQFYESGVTIGDRIEQLCQIVSPKDVSNVAIEARTQMKLRHVPLLLAVGLARRKGLTASTVEAIIQRPDELTEILALYWKDGRCPIANALKKGLARAFPKFDAYQLGKYNRDGAVKLRDVLFLCHPKPKDVAQQDVWDKLVNNTLESPDTWEVNLSAGADKKQTWERLLRENKLGGLALLRNLRNMEQVNVNRELIKKSILSMKVDRVLPFRFISAAAVVPNLEPELEISMLRSCGCVPQLKGHTAVVVDSSGSMESKLSERSVVTRFDAACGIAMICREICENVRVFSFGSTTVEVAPRHGFALRDAIANANTGYYTRMGDCIRTVQKIAPECNRIIAFTDEQTADSVPAPNGRGYIVNVASYQNGIGYGNWVKIDGFSEAILKYIAEYEAVIN